MTTLFWILTLSLFHISIAYRKPRANGRVLGGRECQPEEFPAAIVVKNTLGKLICGGVLINMCHVITAASCSHYPPEYYAIIAGDRTGEDSENRQIGKVKMIFIHPQFNSTTRKNDIAILFIMELLKPSKLVANEKYLALESPEIGSQVIAVGWGETELPSFKRHCLATQLIVLDKNNCTMSLGKMSIVGGGPPDDDDKPGTLTLDKSQICTGDKFGKNLTADGDTGGPVYMMNDTEMVLVGLVSYGHDQAPDVRVFTDISYYRIWIVEITRNPYDYRGKRSGLSPSVRGVNNAANEWKKLKNMEFFILQIITLLMLYKFI